MMKNGWKISLLLLCSATLLSACNGTKTGLERDSLTSDQATVQPQENTNTSDINYDWWENKCYVSDSGGKFYGFRYSDGGEAFFTFGNCCVSIEKGNAELMDDDYFGPIISYTFPTIRRQGNSIINEEYYVFYYIERDYVETVNTSTGVSDTYYYDSSYQIQGGGSSEETYSDSTFPLLSNSRYECFETETGEDAIISIDIQNDTPFIIFPEAVWVELETDGSGDSWKFVNPYFSEENIYTSVVIQGNEITLTTDETFVYDGTYIQLPDEGTDGE